MLNVPVVIVEQPGRTPLHIALSEALEVGRDCAGLLLDDPGISRRHVILRPAGGRVTVMDLGSTNGTVVDGRTIDAPAVLGPDSVVRLGDTTIRLAADRGSGIQVTNIEDLAPLTPIELLAAEVAVRRPSLPEAAEREGSVTVVFAEVPTPVPSDDPGGSQLSSLAERYDGMEVRSSGTASMLVFASAGRALDLLVAAHGETAHGKSPKLRAGVHTGEAIVGDQGDLFSLHVNVAARIAAVSGDDEILVSSVVREILSGRDDVRFGDPRRTELKGLAGTFVVHPVLTR